jgi:hypothetical protein
MTTSTHTISNGAHTQNGAATSSIDSQTWRDAVAIVAQRALDFYGPGMAARVDQARGIVLDGLIQPGREVAYINSEADSETTYEATAKSCSCLDGQRNAPDRM